jgi:DNA polymerase-3 subunit alpha/error-prone DNA polymerase
VLVRQRPGSAGGVIFMTLEDETGVANAIVWPKTFDRYRPIVMGARLVKIQGRLQSQSGVIHTVVEHIEDLTSMLGLLQKETRRFGVSARADEALQSGGDHRGKRRSNGMDDRSSKTAGRDTLQSYVPEPGRVMPKGRNFH